MTGCFRRPDAFTAAAVANAALPTLVFARLLSILAWYH